MSQARLAGRGDAPLSRRGIVCEHKGICLCYYNVYVYNVCVYIYIYIHINNISNTISYNINYRLQNMQNLLTTKSLTSRNKNYKHLHTRNKHVTCVLTKKMRPAPDEEQAA